MEALSYVITAVTKAIRQMADLSHPIACSNCKNDDAVIEITVIPISDSAQHWVGYSSALSNYLFTFVTPFYEDVDKRNTLHQPRPIFNDHRYSQSFNILNDNEETWATIIIQVSSKGWEGEKNYDRCIQIALEKSFAEDNFTIST